ncbi:uncharacterized protein LOC130992968 [Salvia miltiorrhiza]|uniref:uncharacterized protein LOC130992968 n=1 Tax=Salvia miltiorrhiza TaxID=226208 RepID=UPI0025AD0527|nr:uncharacterized protein LOC130992968 [Salvia miltiorrhiza]
MPQVTSHWWQQEPSLLGIGTTKLHATSYLPLVAATPTLSYPKFSCIASPKTRVATNFSHSIHFHSKKVLSLSSSLSIFVPPHLPHSQDSSPTTITLHRSPLSPKRSIKARESVGNLGRKVGVKIVLRGNWFTGRYHRLRSPLFHTEDQVEQWLMEMK